MMKRCIAGMLGLAVLLFASNGWGAPPSDLVKASLLADTKAVQPGQPFRVGVRLRIAPEWHVYWQNPGDGGIPTSVELKLPEGFTASAIQYPIPRRFDAEGGLVSYGYEDEVMLLATITPPAKLDSAHVTIEADANWLVCEKTCVTGDAKLILTLPVGPAEPNESQAFERWIQRLPASIEGSQVETVTWTQTAVEQNESSLSLVVQWTGDAPANIEWFPPASGSALFGKPKVETSGRTSTITTTITRLAGQKPETKPLESVLSYKGSRGRVGVALPVELLK